MNIKQFITQNKGKLVAMVSAHSPEILTSMSVAGLVGTIVLTVRGTLKAEEIIKEAEMVKGDKLTVKETVQTAWRPFVPVVLSATATGACVVASHSINESRRAALMAAYTMAQENLDTYKDKVKEVVGEKKAQEIQDTVLADQIRISERDGVVIDTGYGTTLCYDPMSGRYFRSDIERIRRAQNDLNEQIIGDFSATLNEWYGFLGLNDIKLGEDLGWNSNNMLRVTFSSTLTSGGEPVLVLEYEVFPEYRLL